MQVFGIDFKNQTLFYKVLGYARPVSSTLIAKKYGSLENVVKTRLGIDNDDQAAINLQQLKDNYLNSNTGDHGTSAKSVTNEIDPAVLNVLIMSYQQLNTDDKSLIIKTTARAFKVNAMELSERIDQLVQ